MPNTALIDITSSLEAVHGGNKAKAIWKGTKAAYNTARQWIGGASDVAETVGKVGAAAWAGKQAWDTLRGNNQPAQTPAQQE